MPRLPAPPVYVLAPHLPTAEAIAAAIAAASGRVEVRLPFPADEMHDYTSVADHFLAAAYVGERLARHCASVDAWEDMSSGTYSTYVGGGHGEFAVFTCVVRDGQGFAAELEGLAPLAPEGAWAEDDDADDPEDLDDEDADNEDLGDGDVDGGEEDDDDRSWARSELLSEAYDEITALVDARDQPGARRPVCPEFVNWAFVYLPSTDDFDDEEAAAREARWPGYAEREFVPYPNATRRRTRPHTPRKPSRKPGTD